MISESGRERIARLPAWVRELIQRLEHAKEPLIDEIVRRRREASSLNDKCRRLSESLEAVMEILRAAGRGGSDYARTVVGVLEGYEIFRSGESK